MNLKKILAAGLSIAMLASGSVCAFAETTITDVEDENTASIEVSGSKEDDSTYSGPTYSVTVEWTAVELVYTDTYTYSWDTSNLYYVKSDTASSTNDGGSISITVTNYSDDAVNAAVSYADTENDGITSTLDINGSSVDIETAAQSDGAAIEYTNTSTQGTAATGSFSGAVSISDGAENLTSTTSTIGTVTVTIAASTAEATYTNTASSGETEN